MTAPSIWDEEFITNWDEPLTRVHVSGRSMGWCEWCGKEQATEKHHRINRSQGGKWHPANIIDLCSADHREVTVNPEWAQSVGLSIPGHPHISPSAVPVRNRPNRQPDLWLHDNYLPAGKNAR